jgi:triosephosphate isomerase
MNPLRTPLIAGNWKMYKTPSEAGEFARELALELTESDDRQILICPSFICMDAVIKAVKGTGIFVGSQDAFYRQEGAFTGEVSPTMLKDIGVTHGICGHSERRGFFGETNETVALKVKALLDINMIPILCVGESLAEREEEKTLDVIRTQISAGLKGIDEEQAESVIIAYEPVWAIGTGKTATADQAQEVHASIRKQLSKLYPADTAQGIRILYGGSVKPDNIDTLMAQPDIDGALVGAASLVVDSFIRIAEFRVHV